MRFSISHFCVAIALLITTGIAPPAPTAPPTNRSHLIIIGGHKSDTTPTGPLVGGLGLSLTTKPLKKELPGYVWVALEIRNAGSQPRYFLGLTFLNSYQVIATDKHGIAVPPNPHPGYLIDQGPL